MDQERYKTILDAFLGDAQLMLQLNECTSLEEGHAVVAKKVKDLTLEEFSEAMQILKSVMIAQTQS